jgi:hypothetical protein
MKIISFAGIVKTPGSVQLAPAAPEIQGCAIKPAPVQSCNHALHVWPDRRGFKAMQHKSCPRTGMCKPVDVEKIPIRVLIFSRL